MLAMERLIAFTERGVYVVRGGEQGILTPTTVNPLLMSEEGCSKTVEPKMAGRRGYFLNATHTKLMGIEFADDGNMKVFDASKFSGHFITDSDVHQIEVLGGEETTVFALRRDGKLVRITVNESGAHGFALMDTQDGYIESIYRGKQKRHYRRNHKTPNTVYHDVLMCYVIRNGVRTVERLSIRDDVNKEGEIFMDCAEVFGTRLAESGTDGYVAVGGPDQTVYRDTRFRLNFPTQTWTAGTRTLWAANPDELPIGEYLKIFYGDGQEFLVQVDTGSEVASGDPDYPKEYTVTVFQDIPTELQDVHNQVGLTQTEKNYQLTNWLPAYTGMLYVSGWMEDALDLAGGSKELSVMVEGGILSSPLNPNKTTLSTQYDAINDLYYIDLGTDFYCWGCYGLPIESEFESLDLETSDNRTLTDSMKILNAIGVGMMRTRGGFFGMPDREPAEMEEIALDTDTSTPPKTLNKDGYDRILIPAEWTQPGRANIKNVDPVPMTILSIYPKGLAGGE
jgi:hypothetical protein